MNKKQVMIMHKKYVYAAILAFAAFFAQAQKQGTITYKQTMKMEIQMELDSNMRAMLGDLPTENSTLTHLLFNENTSLFENMKKEDDSERKIEEDGRRIEIKMDVPEEKTWTDFKNQRLVEQKEFMGKKFLIDSAFAKSDWKLTGKQKVILNYPCQQAMKTDKKDTCYAWFTPNIPVAGGPLNLHGLPGMILETTAMNGKLSIVAQQVDLNPIDEKSLVKPKEGKKVTRKEYTKIVDEKTKEMQEQYGGKGNVIIKMETR